MRQSQVFVLAASFAFLATTAACSQRSSNGPILPAGIPAPQTVPAPLTIAAPDVKVRIKEYRLPKAYSSPVHITVGAPGSNLLWFTEFAANALGTISTAGAIRERPLGLRVGAGPDSAAIDALRHGPPANLRPNPTITIPPSGNSPYGITLGPDKKIWFTNENNGANMIGKFTATKTLQFPIQTACCMQNITSGPDGRLWFVISNANDFSTNFVGRITTKGTITLYDLPYGSVPSNVTSGPGNAMWFTEGYGDKIGKMTTAGKLVAEFPIPTAGALLEDIVQGPDGNLWFTEWYGNKVGKMTPKGKVTEYAVPAAYSGLAGITVGPDNALWFCEADANKIGRITTKGALSEFEVPTAYSRPFFITKGPDGALWFTEFEGDRIGRVQIL